MPLNRAESPKGDSEAGRHSRAPSSDAGLFNPVELRLFRYTAVMLSLVALIGLIGLMAWCLGWVVDTFSNLLLPLSLTGVLALVLHPVVEFLERRFRLPRLLAIVVLLLVLFAAMCGVIVLLVPPLVNQFIQLMSVLPETLSSWEEHFSARYPQLSAMVASNVESDGGGKSDSLLTGSGKTIRHYMGLLAGISFVPLLLFFTLLSGRMLRRQVSELLSIFRKQTQSKALYFMDVFLGYVSAFFQGQLIIAASMGILYVLGFTFIGLEYGVLAGVVLGLLNIVPFLGTLIGFLVVLPMASLQQGGGVELLLLTVLVFAIVQLVESWLLTPKIMANRSGLHPALVVISLFFWGTALGGIIGMVLAVPLTAFFVAIWREIKASLIYALNNRPCDS